MILKKLGFVGALGLAGMSQGMALYGISPTFGGYTLLQINSTTGVASELVSFSLPGVQEVRGMTYHPVNHKFYATAVVNEDNSYLYEIDPVLRSVTLVFSGIPTGCFEGIEYSSILGGMVVTYGGATQTDHLALLDNALNPISTSSPSGVGLDMDTLFVDETGALNSLDVNTIFDGFPRHRIGNPFSSPVLSPFGSAFIYSVTDHDVAYDSSLNRVFVSRGSNLAYLIPASTTMTQVGSFGSYDVKALAYGAGRQTVSCNLVLDDTSNPFGSGILRYMFYELKVGSEIAASGQVLVTDSSTPFTMTIPDDFVGAASLQIDGSSFLKTTFAVNLAPNAAFGNLVMANGDTDASGEVDAADIDEVIANFGNIYPSEVGNPDADVDCSGEVDAADIDVVVANFGAVDS